MKPLFWVIIATVVGLLGVLIGYLVRKQKEQRLIGSAEVRAKNLVSDAEKSAEQLRRETLADAREEARGLRQDAEQDIKERRKEIQRQEQRLIQKEESMDKKLENIERKEESIQAKEQSLIDKNKNLDNAIKKQLEELEKISGYTVEEAKKVLLDKTEKEITHETALLIKELENKAKEEADKKAKDVITNAIQRCAADYVAELTVSTVALPNDEMKGRIIGREGRNIRSIETLTGVDLIIDDTPEAVIISGFDPVRREIARVALEKLITDGRIHPARIEEMVEKAEKEVNQIVKEAGEEACLECGIHNLHPELVKILGRLKYRTSYGQNVLKHSIEVSHLAGLMANELGLDVKLCKRGGLLHDIGKALDRQEEGTHVSLGVEQLKRFKESADVINCVEAHHGDCEPKTMEAVLVAAADALSAARPGARRETLEAYIKRLEKLEEIANDTPGVEKSFAIQAGREIRIIAKPEDVNDDEIVLLAREISKKIESELEYPGQIKVNVVRETHAIDYAK